MYVAILFGVFVRGLRTREGTKSDLLLMDLFWLSQKVSRMLYTLYMWILLVQEVAIVCIDCVCCACSCFGSFVMIPWDFSIKTIWRDFESRLAMY